MTTTELTNPVLERAQVTGPAAVFALRESHCKWPIGEPGKPEFRFCGKRSSVDSPYCTHHHQVALRD
jgi:GcrA cell cycle regulator